MAYYRNYNRNNYGKKLWGRRKSKYTKAEQIAFRLGQEKKIKQSINNLNADTRVRDAYFKGLNGMPSSKKPLF